ncbi:hypothetical protein Zmor_016970 [Zophobas morio]|uniref:Uncharacterized protein n=1 Tax=Zophobas morio TaxID=2755281 RepID=A0AA38I7M1_9CUCU|nr:hypothetical protein Zmor_016970 [Zophobas morio]
MKLTICVFVFLAVGNNAKLPSNFKKCKYNSPDMEKCFLDAVQDGITQTTKAYPEINLASFSPLEILELAIKAGSEAVVNVDQNFKNCTLYGVPQTVLDEIDFEGKFIQGSGVIPELKKDCSYELNGRVLLLPIVGSGPSTVILTNVKAKLHLDYEQVKKNGKTFMHGTSIKLDLDPETISYHFENLFNGDKQLGDNINAVLNENSKEVFQDVKSGYENGIAMVLLQIINNLFSKLSMEEAFDYSGGQ